LHKQKKLNAFGMNELDQSFSMHLTLQISKLWALGSLDFQIFDTSDIEILKESAI
jgi:hypothetical protein